MALDAQKMEVLMSNQKKVLVIQTAFPGDAILTLPFIQELKKTNSDFMLDVLCTPLTSEIFKSSPYVDNVIVVDKRGKHKSVLAFIRLLKELKQIHYEIVYSPHRSLRSALIALNLGAVESYGFDNSSLKFAFKKVVSYNPQDHEVKRNLKFLESEYVDDKWRIIPEIIVQDQSRLKVKIFLLSNKIERFITIAPGSVWETKKYPADYFRKVIAHFLQKKFVIVLIGGKDDRDLCESLKQDFSENVFVTAGDFSFIETIELLRNTMLLISNDSAPTHLGMCADIPVLTIYCSTVPQFGFYPYNKKSDYISVDNLYCKPCGIHGYRNCPTGTFDCARLLTPDIVTKKAESLLANAV